MKSLNCLFNGPTPASFVFIFDLFTLQIDVGTSAWDLNPEVHNGRHRPEKTSLRRQIYRAKAATNPKCCLLIHTFIDENILDFHGGFPIQEKARPFNCSIYFQFIF